MHQRIMGSTFDQRSLLHYKDQIGILNRGKAMGNHNNCFAFDQSLEGFLDLLFILWISIGSRLIHDHNGSIF